MVSDESNDENAENQNGAAPAAQTEEQLLQDLEKQKKEYLYLYAEFDNFRKKSIKERSDLVKYGGERLILALLEVTDNFDRAMQTIDSADPQAIIAGLKLVHSELKEILKRFGVEEINPMGQQFDPTQHEALTSEETDKFPEGFVSQVSKSAYKLHDRLVRPAQVIVAKKPANT